jgi:hypothetical protein
MSIENQALNSPDPVKTLEPENTDHPEREIWVVANVYLDTDGFNNLVSCAVVCMDGLEEAKKVARDKADELLKIYNEEMEYQRKPLLKFEDAWSPIDHWDGIEHEYGWHPENNDVSWATIRVFKASVSKEA